MPQTPWYRRAEILQQQQVPPPVQEEPGGLWSQIKDLGKAGGEQLSKWLAQADLYARDRDAMHFLQMKEAAGLPVSASDYYMAIRKARDPLYEVSPKDVLLGTAATLGEGPSIGAGASVGAGLGTAVFPGVGTAVGAGLGGLGAWLAARHLQGMANPEIAGQNVLWDVAGLGGAKLAQAAIAPRLAKTKVGKVLLQEVKGVPKALKEVKLQGELPWTNPPSQMRLPLEYKPQKSVKELLDELPPVPEKIPTLEDWKKEPLFKPKRMPKNQVKIKGFKGKTQIVRTPQGKIRVTKGKAGTSIPIRPQEKMTPLQLSVAARGGIAPHFLGDIADITTSEKAVAPILLRSKPVPTRLGKKFEIYQSPIPIPGGASAVTWGQAGPLKTKHAIILGREASGKPTTRSMFHEIGHQLMRKVDAGEAVHPAVRRALRSFRQAHTSIFKGKIKGLPRGGSYYGQENEAWAQVVAKAFEGKTAAKGRFKDAIIELQPFVERMRKLMVTDPKRAKYLLALVAPGLSYASLSKAHASG